MYKIFIVEDDTAIADTMKTHLSKWNYEVCCVTDYKHVMREFADFAPQLVLLDIGLPFYNGFYWCAEIRKVSKVPIIFISSMDDSMNIVMAMNMGGDEFIEKPFNLNVLTAKVQAMLRRTYSFLEAVNVIEYKGCMLNLNDAVFIGPKGNIELTKNEFRILKLLLEHTGKIVSRDNLIARLWESDEFVDENTLTVNVARLRKKLETGGMSDMIVTKKGIGYLIKE